MPELKHVRKRPRKLPGDTQRVPTGCGTLTITLNRDEDGKLFEVFLRMGKSGGCASATLEAIGRAVSIGLRAGVAPEEYIKTLGGIGCHLHTLDNGEKVMSCIDALSREMAKANGGGEAKEGDGGPTKLG